ncbi:MAG: helix-turn-helix domain-containing protein [Paracoccaceae bacterium]
MPLPAFGKHLRQMRRDLGLSQFDLALALGSTQRHISFLETGRSEPSRAMILRIATELSLSMAQRAALFTASGFHSPFAQHAPNSDEVAQALDLIEARVLTHWPFPGFVLDKSWNILRLNKPAQNMFGPFAPPSNEPLNLLALFLSDPFRALIENWPQASTAFYFRLLEAQDHSPKVAQAFAQARKDGHFDHIAAELTDPVDQPIFVPIKVNFPGAAQPLQITSLIGRLANVHDAVVEGIEVELMVPLDPYGEGALGGFA